MASITWGTTVTPAPDGDIVRHVPAMLAVEFKERTEVGPFTTGPVPKVKLVFAAVTRL